MSIEDYVSVEGPVAFVISLTAKIRLSMWPTESTMASENGKEKK